MTKRESKIAVVTGAASGIGAQICAELTEAGWITASLDLRKTAHADLSFIVDVTDADAVSQAVSTVCKDLGPINGAVACAGHYEEVDLLDISSSAWRSMLRVHVGGLLNLIKAVVPVMQVAGSGRFVTIASERAIGGGSRDAHYANTRRQDLR